MKVKNLMILSISFLLSCNDDILDLSSQTELSTDNFFSTEKDLYFAANALYASSHWSNLYLENITDNCTNNHTWDPPYDIATGAVTPFNGYVYGFWDNNYRYIQTANRLIEGAGRVKDISEEKRLQHIGEAQFFRALMYAQLVDLFGDVPFMTTQISPVETKDVVRADKSEIRDFLVSDLTDAASSLPLVAEQWGRVTKGAALALKSRILLYDERWAEAASAAKEVMDLGVYSLHPSYEELFQYEGEQSSEIIFSRQYSDLTGHRHQMTIEIGSSVAFDGWANWLPTKDLIDTYECTDGLTIDESPLYDERFPWDNRDPRLHQTILYPGREYLDGYWTSIPGFDFGNEKVYEDMGDNGLSWNLPKSGYMFYKYQQPQDFYNDVVWEGHIDLILIRYAEVLLNYAEAKLEAGDIDQSVYDAINEIRQRPSVDMPLISNGKSVDELREIIRRERRVELVFEGLRLFDIRRWRIAEDVMNRTPYGAPVANPATINPITYLTGWQTNVFDPSRDYLWPIPQTEIDQLNIKQNPNW